MSFGWYRYAHNKINMLYNAGAISHGANKIGRIVVIGSASMFEDAWMDKEDNAKLLIFLCSWLSHQCNIQVFI